MADFNQDPYNLTTDPLKQNVGRDASGVTDALQRLRGLQGALQSGQIDYDTYQKLFSQFDPQALQSVGSYTAGGSQQATAGNAAGATTFAGLSQEGGSDLNTFAKQYQNLTGQAPTAQQINDYFTNVAPQLAGTNVADQNSLINNFLSTQYQPQIQQYQQQQQTNNLNTAQQTAQNLIQQQNQADITNLTDPANMAKIEQSFNQNGLLNSGVFSQGLADQLAQATNSNVANAIGGITIPGIENIQNTQNAPYQQFLNGLQPGLGQAGQNQQSQLNFNQESQLAQQLADMGSPSELQQWAPILQGALQGGGAAASGKTYLCTHMKNLGLMTEDEVDAVHRKIFPYAFLHPLDLIAYAVTAPTFILIANDWMDWNALKPRLCDEIICCKSSREAFRRYKAVCEEIFFGKEIRYGV